MSNPNTTIFRSYDPFIMGITSSILGLSIGFGESNSTTSLKEFALIAGSVLLLTIIAGIRYAIKNTIKAYDDPDRLDEEKVDARYVNFLLAATVGIFIGFTIGFTTVQVARKNWAIFDQSHSRALSQWIGVKNPMNFQALSYQFGYKLLAGLIALAIAITAYKIAFLKGKEEHNGYFNRYKWLNAVIPGFILTGCIYGSNIILHDIATIIANSTRPIIGTLWQNTILSVNWWGNINSFGGVSNPGNIQKNWHKNWYSGHTSWVATAFWLSLFVTIYYLRKTEKTVAQRNKYSKTLAILTTAVLGGFTLSTGAFRVLGLAHTINAVISGALIPMFTVTIGIFLFLGLKKIAGSCPSKFSSCSRSTAVLFPSNGQNQGSANENLVDNNNNNNNITQKTG